jgi:hypothetical protein
MVAIAVALLLQTPPVVVFANDIVAFTQTAVAPVIEAITGKAFTFTIYDAELIQPFAFVKV